MELNELILPELLVVSYIAVRCVTGNSCCSYKAVNPYWQSWVKPKQRKA